MNADFPQYSSLAQSVERMTVNHDVAGSSPAGGATRRLENITFSSLFLRLWGFFLPVYFLTFGWLLPNDCKPKCEHGCCKLHHFKIQI